MDYKFVVDAPDLIDSVQKAAAVSPSKQGAFAASAGIKFEPQDGFLLLKSTDMETRYRGQIPILSSEGLGETFRLPSTVLAGWLGRLSIHEKSRVEFGVSLATSKVYLKCGSSQAQFTIIADDTFVQIDAFDTSSLVAVADLGVKLKKISWACGKTPPLDGIHIDGTRLVALSHGMAAVMEAPVNVDKAITAPLGSITTALRGRSGPVHLGVDGQKLLVMPDEADQYTTTIYVQDYPNLDVITPEDSALRWTTVSKGPISAALGRINALAGLDKEIGSVTIFVEGDEMYLEAQVDEYGRVDETVPMDSPFPENESLQIRFQPRLLQSAIDAVGAQMFQIGWPATPIKPMKLRDGHSGYWALVMPMRPK